MLCAGGEDARRGGGGDITLTTLARARAITLTTLRSRRGVERYGGSRTVPGEARRKALLWRGLRRGDDEGIGKGLGPLGDLTF